MFENIYIIEKLAEMREEEIRVKLDRSYQVKYLRNKTEKNYLQRSKFNIKKNKILYLLKMYRMPW